MGHSRHQCVFRGLIAIELSNGNAFAQDKDTIGAFNHLFQFSTRSSKPQVPDRQAT